MRAGTRASIVFPTLDRRKYFRAGGGDNDGELRPPRGAESGELSREGERDECLDG